MNLWKDKSIATSLTIGGTTSTVGQNQKVKTFTVKATGRYWIQIYADSATTLTAKDVKIELGTRATKYVPNLEEIQERKMDGTTAVYHSVDLNSITGSGTFAVVGASNIPVDSGNYGNLMVFNCSPYITQLWHDGKANSLYTRFFDGTNAGGNTWTAWSKL